jgi:7,8-dihydropterin-6-yl-methyl-4-(beta-D-ribofuranosyl)aminobenzene 5'-phosphate synthase
MKTRPIQALKITTLAENSAWSGLLGQWGLSFLLELVDSKGKSRKVVMDSGINKRALFYNTKKLKTDLSDVDCIVVSHGHLDHTAATAEIAKMAGGVKIYAHPHTFLHRFHKDKNGKKRNIGVPKGEGIAEIEKAGGKVVLTSKPTEILPGVMTTGEIERTTAFEKPLPLSKSESLVILVDRREINDQILDDQSLWMHVQKEGTYVVTGCAHAGLINTLQHVQRATQSEEIRAVMGGTHLVGRSDDYIRKTIAELKKFELKLFSPCHCTGFKATASLWNAFPEAFVLNFSGRVIEAGKEPRPRIT